MISILGTKRVDIAKLKLDPSFKARLDAPHVADRAHSIDNLGLVYEPLVRAADWRVIDGRDRIAAHVKLGKPTVLCKLVECTDDECEVLERITTIERRHDPLEQATALRELVDRYASQVPYSNEPRGPGRPKERRTVALEKAASALGVTPQALKMREYRQRAKAASSTPGTLQPPAPPVRTFGLDIERSFLEQMAQIQSFIDDAAGKLTAAAGELTRLKNSGAPFPEARLERMRADLKEVSARIRGSRPKSLCPYCKGQPGYQDHCVACAGCGWTSDSQENGMPGELLRDVDPVIMDGGTMVPLASVGEEVF